MTFAAYVSTGTDCSSDVTGHQAKAATDLTSRPGQPGVRCVCLSVKESGHMIECEQCLHWCHSKCVGVGPPVANTNPFICPYGVRSLLREVSSLRSEVAALKDQLSRVSQTVQFPSVGEWMMLSDDNTGNGLPSASSSSLPTVAHPKGVRSSFSDSSGRWFNLIVSSIGEQATGTPRAVRLREDSVEVLSVLPPLLPSFSDHTIRDCSRLGKFNSDKTWPLLVTLTHTSDVATILSNKSFLADHPHLQILPDLPPHLRKSRFILLKVHHDLIASGIDRKSIIFGPILSILIVSSKDLLSIM